MKITMGTKLLRIIPVTIAILAVIEIILINQAAGSGRKIQEIDRSVDALREQNNLLEQYVASASSLMTIAVKSRDMGFVTPTKTQFVTMYQDQLPVAYRSQ